MRELKDAIIIMGKVNLKEDLNDEEVSAIIAFFKTLTGNVPEGAARFPEELRK